MVPEPCKAVIYCRISQDRRGEGSGVERQRADCQKLADELGWDVVHVYTDNDVSAYGRKPRPEYVNMLKRLSRGDINGLLAWHTDRLYRSIPDLSELVGVCEANNVEIRTVKAGQVDLSTPTGRFNASLYASVARLEVERSAERLRSAKEQQARDGKFRGGPRPFGYKDGGMELEQAEADALREAAAHVLAGGSLMSVTKRWAVDGMKTARGKDKWTVTSLRKVLVRERNAGLVEQDGRVIGPALWPAIFDVDTLRAVQAVLSDPSRRTAVSYERAHQGAGIYRCGKCGGPMKVYKDSSGPIYRCVDKPHLSQRKEALDEFVSAVVVERLTQPDAAEVFATDSEDVDTWALQVERDGLQARKDELASLFAAGAIDGSQLRRGSDELQEKISRVDARLAAARQSSPIADLVLSDDVRERWDSMSPDIRNKVIDALMTVTVLPVGSGQKARGGGLIVERVDVQWKGTAPSHELPSTE